MPLPPPAHSARVHARQLCGCSTRGAGDSFVGAFAYGLAAGMSGPDSLALGAAAASATVTTPATALCTHEMVMGYLPQCGASLIEE